MPVDDHPEITKWLKDSERLLFDMKLRAAVERTLPHRQSHQPLIPHDCWHCSRKTADLTPSAWLCVGCSNWLSERSDTNPRNARQVVVNSYMETGQNAPYGFPDMNGTLGDIQLPN